jgi:predicted transcriptional regulator
MKPAEIEERFPRPISNMALRSLLRVLMEKGHVRRRKSGRAFHYQSITPRSRALKKMTRQMAQVFAGGSSLALIAQLIQSERLTEDDIRELQRLAVADGSDRPRLRKEKSR